MTRAAGTWTRKEADERRATILAALKETGGNVSRAADALGCSRQTLYSHAVRLGLQREFGLRDPDAPEPDPEAPPGYRYSATVRIDAALWRWVRHVAIDKQWTTSAVVEHALERLRESETAPEKGKPRSAERTRSGSTTG